jgi:hypothetical protein
MALGRGDAALDEWGVAIDLDPDDPRPYLGRARAATQLGLREDFAPADLEKAAAHAGDQPALLLEVAREYARCVGDRGDHVPRVVALASQALGLYVRALPVAAPPTATADSGGSKTSRD